jgi:hypothetical protein
LSGSSSRPGIGDDDVLGLEPELMRRAVEVRVSACFR